jgi:DNA-binding transcriptional regulator/RsmH inhibitor MraZ
MARPISDETLRKMQIILRFELPNTHRTALKLKRSFMDQLDQCKTDEQRRILLGISK